MQNGKTWILVADASKARIFSTYKARLFTNGNGHADNMELIGQYTHNASRKSDRELVSDKLGVYGTNTFAPDTDPKAHEADLFAQQLIKQLTQNYNEGLYRDIIFVAPPTFMGLLNKHAQHHQIEKFVTQTIEKDYTHQDSQTLTSSLLTHF